MKWFILLPLSACALLASCAYVQTHKNVEQWGTHYTGYRLAPPLQLYRQGSEWYLAGEPLKLRKHYPLVHDTIFRVRNNEPTMEPLADKAGQGADVAYHRISAGTAHVLQREDGYAQWATLGKEIEADPTPWLKALPGAEQVPVRAQVEGQGAIAVEGGRRPAQTPWGNWAVSKLDWVVVDVPGTVIYNVSIPFAAPFVFFWEFLTED